jgi:hypothetical protein
MRGTVVAVAADDDELVLFRIPREISHSSSIRV